MIFSSLIFICALFPFSWSALLEIYLVNLPREHVFVLTAQILLCFINSVISLYFLIVYPYTLYNLLSWMFTYYFIFFF